jgi:RNA polymerase sigma-70 factor (ECF subfamily)
VTDDELVQRARQGDTAAFDQLVVRHQAAVFRAALAALRVREDAEEATQDAFVRAWASLGRFRGDSSFRTWLLTIAWRRALSRRRSLAAWFKRAAPLDSVPTGEMAVRSGLRADDRVRDAELRGHIVRAIDALSPKLRDALLLAQSGEYDYAEMAAMLKVPLGTLKFRVSDARRRVRERLVKLGYVDAR